MLQAKYLRSVKGGTLHVYAVSGPKTALETFEAIQGENFRSDEKTGKPVWFTKKFNGNFVQLEVRENSETGEEYFAPILSEEFMIKMQIIKDSMNVGSVASQVRQTVEDDADLDS
jgi:hypothetical protein